MFRTRITAVLSAALLALAGTLVAATPARAAGTTAPPGAPVISQLTAVSAVVQWAPSPTPGVTYYILESLVGGQWLGLQVTGQITSSLTSVYVQLQPATTYTFAVVAGGTTESPRGPSTTFTTPARDTTLTCSVTLSPITWATGFYATGYFKNTSSFIIDGWTLRFTLPGDAHVTSGFSGTFTQVGRDVTVVNTPYNGRVDAFGQVGFGFTGTYTGTFGKPSAYTLNGVSCTVF